MTRIFSLAACVLIPGLMMAQNTPSVPSGSFAITHVRLFDGEHTLPDQTVIVRDGKIVVVGSKVTVPPGTPEIEGAGRTLLPGLIDAHVHAYPENSLREAEALGVTTVLDMFSDPNMVQRKKTEEGKGAGLAGADIFSAGIAATVPHGHGTEYGFEIPTLTTPAEAPDWVDARIAEGSDYIKIILESGRGYGRTIPTLDQPTIKALVSATHKRHKLAVLHIGAYEDARAAVEAGADGLMHLFIDRHPEPGFGEFVAAHHVFVVPTLSVLLSVAGTNIEGKSLASDKRITDYLPAADIYALRTAFGGGEHAHYEAAVASIKQLKTAHVDILAGTDAPNPGTMFGASLHGELELLVAAGLTPEEALRTATSTPAKCFNLNDRGHVAEGQRADLLLVTGDPTVNITETRNIVAVWKSGQADDRASYAKDIAAAKKSSAIDAAPLAVGDGSISTFEDGTDHCAFGVGWSKSTDCIFGGKSTTAYEIISEGANGSKKSLRISGEIAAGLPFAWAGAMFSPGAAPFAPANLSKAKGLQFWAKGDGKTFRVMFFTATGGNIPQVATFTAGTDWKHFSFPFSTFGGSDGHDVSAILFTGGPEAGKFNFQIDEVGLVH